MKSSFKTIDACTDTGIQVDQGLTYSVTISIDQPWFDGSKTCADVLGVKPNPDFWVSTVHATATLMKRWWSEPYFRPIARIGQFGNDEYVLAPVKPLKATDGCLNNTLTAHITPRRSGRLYVYVNDAILGLPWLYDHFYGHNNEGTATITVDPVD